jgi:hypothetical protein
VPNDFLAEMVHALEVFLEGRVGVALLHEEPRTQRFVFDKKETTSILRIEEFQDFIVAYNIANTIPSSSKYQLRLEWEDEPKKIAKVFWRGLKNLESRISTDLTLEHWDRGFPAKQLRRLEEKLKT